MKQLTILVFSGLSLLTSGVQAELINAIDTDYGLSVKGGNGFGGDFSTQAIWTAGSQRSDNGSADANNRRAGRVFVEFSLTSAAIAEAAIAGAEVQLGFLVDSIGSGVSGTPYTDGLDVRFLGVSAIDRTAGTLWNTAGIGADQADVVPTSGPATSYNVTLTNPNVLTLIAGASPGTQIAFGLSNSLGVDLFAPVGNSTAETYGFQLNQLPVTWSLNVSAVPEPASMTLLLLGLGIARRRMRSARR